MAKPRAAARMPPPTELLEPAPVKIGDEVGDKLEVVPLDPPVPTGTTADSARVVGTADPAPGAVACAATEVVEAMTAGG